MCDPEQLKQLSNHLPEAEEPRSRSCRELGAAEPEAFLRGRAAVCPHRDACGAAAAARGAPGGGGGGGVSVRHQAESVHPSPGAEDVLLRDPVRDRHRRGRMLQLQGLPRCVCVRACVCVCNKHNIKWCSTTAGHVLNCSFRNLNFQPKTEITAT